eukprot:CAMPEP_0202685720 /NCGR_PEP_ID=MMETSP1385-20130828/1551_1 /ASSEMBLY_ACC=CAM_ASM_000861 /TAXON_ID=933848 /ORGANISM="Elphidium margaritaceum" /LENGTH=537 /DNA_ID=CAMNT_0049340147 /DNA_START=39 /DNA_END=1652 /DNA_ORIENTATION=+
MLLNKERVDDEDTKEDVELLAGNATKTKAALESALHLEQTEKALAGAVSKQAVHVDNKTAVATWLSCELRLDDFNFKEQTFTITGWINVHWKWEAEHIDGVPALMALASWNGNKYKSLTSIDEARETDQDITAPIVSQPSAISLSSSYESSSFSTTDAEIFKTAKLMLNEKDGPVIVVKDLRGSSLNDYIPIAAERIFLRPSALMFQHIVPPYLKYYQRTRIVHTSYYVTAVLCQDLQLMLFPFDRHFLDIKLRWNLNGIKNGYEIHKDMYEDKRWCQDWFPAAGRERYLYFDHPFKLSLKESLTYTVKLYPTWITFNCARSTPYHALIRLRVRRTPSGFVTDVLIPIFLIVLSSFSVFAIAPSEPGERLQLSLTVLLTFAAFQHTVSESLPETPGNIIVDWYILAAYLIQAAVIGFTCLIAYLIDDDDIRDHETEHRIDFIFCVGLGSLWIVMSVCYWMLRYNSCRLRYKRKCAPKTTYKTKCCFCLAWKCCKRCCCMDSSADNDEWEQMKQTILKQTDDKDDVFPVLYHEARWQI